MWHMPAQLSSWLRKVIDFWPADSTAPNGLRSQANLSVSLCAPFSAVDLNNGADNTYLASGGGDGSSSLIEAKATAGFNSPRRD